MDADDKLENNALLIGGAGAVGLGFIDPIAGGIANFGLITLQYIFQLRGRKWAGYVNEIAEAVTPKVFTKLLEDEEFKNYFYNLTLIAMAAEDERKLVRLRNAAINRALSPAPEDITYSKFLYVLQRVNEWHIIFLQIFADTKHYFPNATPEDTRSQLIRQHYTTLTDEEFNHIIEDLAELRLTRSARQTMESLKHDMPLKAASDLLSPFGHAFLKFISEPPPDEAPKL